MPTPERQSSAPTRDRLEAVAAEWLARRDAGLSVAERTEFDAWLAADARHAAAWAEVESAWTAFDRPRQVGVADELFARLRARQRRRWRIRAGVAGGLAAAACAVFLLSVQPAWRQSSAEHVAGGILSKPEKRMLGDGSVVELNAGAEIVVAYSTARRDVRLLRGEAHFEVKKDAARPFIVTAGVIEVQAVGTAFAVKLHPQAVDVLVTEGRVAVDRPRPIDTVGGQVSSQSAAAVTPTEPLYIGRGGRISVPVSGASSDPLPQQAETVAAQEMERLLAWRGPRLELLGTPLSEAVRTMNRENSLRIVIRDDDLGAMRLSGVFRADDAEGFVRLLELHYGVAAERVGSGEVVLRKAR